MMQQAATDAAADAALSSRSSRYCHTATATPEQQMRAAAGGAVTRRPRINCRDSSATNQPRLLRRRVIPARQMLRRWRHAALVKLFLTGFDCSSVLLALVLISFHWISSLPSGPPALLGISNDSSDNEGLPSKMFASAFTIPPSSQSQIIRKYPRHDFQFMQLQTRQRFFELLDNKSERQREQQSEGNEEIFSNQASPEETYINLAMNAWGDGGSVEQIKLVNSDDDLMPSSLDEKASSSSSFSSLMMEDKLLSSSPSTEAIVTKGTSSSPSAAPPFPLKAPLEGTARSNNSINGSGPFELFGGIGAKLFGRDGTNNNSSQLPLLKLLNDSITPKSTAAAAAAAEQSSFNPTTQTQNWDEESDIPYGLRVGVYKSNDSKPSFPPPLSRGSSEKVMKGSATTPKSTTTTTTSIPKIAMEKKQQQQQQQLLVMKNQQTMMTNKLKGATDAAGSSRNTVTTNSINSSSSNDDIKGEKKEMISQQKMMMSIMTKEQMKLPPPSSPLTKSTIDTSTPSSPYSTSFQTMGVSNVIESKKTTASSSSPIINNISLQSPPPSSVSSSMSNENDHNNNINKTDQKPSSSSSTAVLIAIDKIKEEIAQTKTWIENEQQNSSSTVANTTVQQSSSSISSTAAAAAEAASAVLKSIDDNKEEIAQSKAWIENEKRLDDIKRQVAEIQGGGITVPPRSIASVSKFPSLTVANAANEKEDGREGGELTVQEVKTENASELDVSSVAERAVEEAVAAEAVAAAAEAFAKKAQEEAAAAAAAAEAAANAVIKKATEKEPAAVDSATTFTTAAPAAVAEMSTLKKEDAEEQSTEDWIEKQNRVVKQRNTQRMARENRTIQNEAIVAAAAKIEEDARLKELVMKASETLFEGFTVDEAEMVRRARLLNEEPKEAKGQDVLKKMASSPERMFEGMTADEAEVIRNGRLNEPTDPKGSNRVIGSENSGFPSKRVPSENVVEFGSMKKGMPLKGESFKGIKTPFPTQPLQVGASKVESSAPPSKMEKGRIISKTLKDSVDVVGVKGKGFASYKGDLKLDTQQQKYLEIAIESWSKFFSDQISQEEYVNLALLAWEDAAKVGVGGDGMKNVAVVGIEALNATSNDDGLYRRPPQISKNSTSSPTVSAASAEKTESNVSLDGSSRNTSTASPSSVLGYSSSGVETGESSSAKKQQPNIAMTVVKVEKPRSEQIPSGEYWLAEQNRLADERRKARLFSNVSSDTENAAGNRLKGSDRAFGLEQSSLSSKRVLPAKKGVEFGSIKKGMPMKGESFKGFKTPFPKSFVKQNISKIEASKLETTAPPIMQSTLLSKKVLFSKEVVEFGGFSEGAPLKGARVAKFPSSRAASAANEDEDGGGGGGGELTLQEVKTENDFKSVAAAVAKKADEAAVAAAAEASAKKAQEDDAGVAEAAANAVAKKAAEKEPAAVNSAATTSTTTAPAAAAEISTIEEEDAEEQSTEDWIEKQNQVVKQRNTQRMARENRTIQNEAIMAAAAKIEEDARLEELVIKASETSFEGFTADEAEMVRRARLLNEEPKEAKGQDVLKKMASSSERMFEGMSADEAEVIRNGRLNELTDPKGSNRVIGSENSGFPSKIAMQSIENQRASLNLTEVDALLGCLGDIDVSSLPILRVGSRIRSSAYGTTHQALLICPVDDGEYEILPCVAKRPWTLPELYANVPSKVLTFEDPQSESSFEESTQPDSWEVDYKAKSIRRYWEVEIHCNKKFQQKKDHYKQLEEVKDHKRKEEGGGDSDGLDDGVSFAIHVADVTIPRFYSVYRDDGSGGTNEDDMIPEYGLFGEDVWGKTIELGHDWLVYEGKLGANELTLLDAMMIQHEVNNQYLEHGYQIHHLFGIQQAMKLPETYGFGDVMDVIFRSLLENIAFVASCNVVHREINPCNIICDAENRRLTIINFGDAVDLDPKETVRVGLDNDSLKSNTPGSIANSLAADVFSVALVVCELLFDFDEVTFTAQIKEVGYDLDTWLQRTLVAEERPLGLDEAFWYLSERRGLWALLKSMVKPNPLRRKITSTSLQQFNEIIALKNGKIEGTESVVAGGDESFLNSVLFPSDSDEGSFESVETGRKTPPSTRKITTESNVDIPQTQYASTLPRVPLSSSILTELAEKPNGAVERNEGVRGEGPNPNPKMRNLSLTSSASNGDAYSDITRATFTPARESKLTAMLSPKTRDRISLKQQRSPEQQRGNFFDITRAPFERVSPQPMALTASQLYSILRESDAGMAPQFRYDKSQLGYIPSQEEYRGQTVLPQRAFSVNTFPRGYVPARTTESISQESYEEIERWLLSYLPRLQKADVSNYCWSLIDEGFDSAEMLEELEFNDLHFMKKAHRRALIKKLSSEVGSRQSYPKKVYKVEEAREPARKGIEALVAGSKSVLLPKAEEIPQQTLNDEQKQFLEQLQAYETKIVADNVKQERMQSSTSRSDEERKLKELQEKIEMELQIRFKDVSRLRELEKEIEQQQLIIESERIKAQQGVNYVISTDTKWIEEKKEIAHERNLTSLATREKMSRQNETKISTVNSGQKSRLANLIAKASETSFEGMTADEAEMVRKARLNEATKQLEKKAENYVMKDDTPDSKEDWYAAQNRLVEKRRKARLSREKRNE